MLQELRYALRRLNGARTFAAVATLTIAIGAGALGGRGRCARGFIARLPFPEPERIVVLNGEMRRDDVQFALVTAETALAIVLLIGTTLVPALRATRIDAITAIRTE